jgi:hypothetical protein
MKIGAVERAEQHWSISRCDKLVMVGQALTYAGQEATVGLRLPLLAGQARSRDTATPWTGPLLWASECARRAGRHETAESTIHVSRTALQDLAWASHGGQGFVAGG